MTESTSTDNNSTDQTQRSFPSKIYYDRESIERVANMLDEAVKQCVVMRDRAPRLYISAMKRPARIAHNEGNKALVETIRRHIESFIEDEDVEFDGFFFDDED